MRARTKPHTPDPSSIEYPCGRTTVRLLGGDGASYIHLIERLRDALPDGPTQDMEAGNCALAVGLYALWDDPVIEWRYTETDPDEVMLLDGEELVRVGRRLAAELFGPGSRRCGLDLRQIGQEVMPRAAYGLPPEGKSEPLPVEN